MSLPFLISGVVYDTDTTTTLASVTVRARNETTNDRLETTTNAEGQYIIDCANFAGGYNSTTDSVTIYVYYENAQDSETVVLSAGTHTANLTLVTVVDSSLIYYCTVQDIWDELDDLGSSDISARRIVKAIQRSEGEIEANTHTFFREVTITNEYYDFNQYSSHKSPERLLEISPIQRHDYMNTIFNDSFFLKHYPITSITTLSTNSASVSSTDSWTALTEQTGSGGDFVWETTGLVRFINNGPSYGKRRIRMTYNYGYATVPKTVERLTILLSIRDIIMSKMHSNQFNVQDNVSIGEISISKNIAQSVGYMRWINGEIDRLYSEIGKMKNEAQ